MAIRVRNATLLLVLFAALLSNPPDLSSCGPFLPTAAFSFWKGPDDGPGRFARGQLGVVQPGFPRFYLIIAYRYLAGIGLNAEERAALFGPEPAYPTPWVVQQPEAVEQWKQARAGVAGGAAPSNINLFRTLSGQNYYLTYLNCNEDAFRTAAKTLGDRIRRFGLQSSVVKEWAAAQDQVFANCSRGQSIPAPLEGTSDPLARADRTYQIAAAHFYAGDYDAAEQMFRAIAQERSSPWSETAPYLAARCVVRKAMLSVKGQGFDREGLAAAEAQLQKILNDPARSAVHPAARRLLDYVETRLDPGERMRTLGQALVQKNAQATIQQNSLDYRFLYDQLESGNLGGLKALPIDDDLSAWILAFQSHDAESAKRAVSEWHSKRTMPWLIAAISMAHAGDPAANELVAAAHKVSHDSPGYPTAAFHAIRIMEELKQTEAARSRLDRLLASDAAAMPGSSVNLFRAERMKAAANWEEFLKYSVRTPVGTAIAYTQYSGDAQPESEEPGTVQTKPRAGFDVDAARIVNEQTPVELWLDAARRETLPQSVRREVASAGWVRAVLLGDERTARSLAPILQNLRPELKPLLQAYLDAGDARARKFAAVFVMLRNPGMRPYVQVGFGRETPIDKIDDFRDNWWCSFAPASNNSVPGYYRDASVMGEPLRELYQDGAPKAEFLPLDQQARGAREWSQLTTLATAPDYLAAQTIDWAKSNADDLRAPEALHLAVRATRYGCSEQGTPYSRQAFDLLHKRYPNSEWTAKTKYWY
jgi:hypothetical protein